VASKLTESPNRALLVGAPRPLLSKRSEAALGSRHREVLNGLEKLFLAGELGILTIGELATRLGCSRRTLYELAPSKEQLFLLVLDRVMHRIGQTAIAAVDPKLPASVQLRQYAIGSLRYAFGSLAYDDVSEVGGAARAVDRHYAFATSVIERIVAGGIDNGEFRPVNPSVAAVVILASAVHLARPDVLEDLGLSLVDAVSQMLEIAVAGLTSQLNLDS
jgi:AcrR family transcriptional regulator